MAQWLRALTVYIRGPDVYTDTQTSKFKNRKTNQKSTQGLKNYFSWQSGCFYA